MNEWFFHGALAIALVGVSFSWAAGPSNGGGGDVVVLPNDGVVLADPFLDHGAPQPDNMPPARALNPRILQMAALYGESLSPIFRNLVYQTSIRQEITKLSRRESRLRFYGVRNQEELNRFCAPGGQKNYRLPPGYTVMQVACTAGDETFLVEPLFSQLSLRDQVLLLIHERLTTLRDKFGGKNYSAIARFTTGLGSYLEIYREQAKGQFRELTATEVSNLSGLYTAIEEIELRDSTPTIEAFGWQAHPYGGGPVHQTASVDPTALVSLRGVVPPKSTVESAAKVVSISTDLRTWPVMQIGPGAEIRGLSLLSFDVGQRSCHTLSLLKMHKGAKIAEWTSVNCLDSLELGSNTLVEQTALEGSGHSTLRIGANSSLIRSKVSSDRDFEIPEILEGQSLIDGEVSSETASYLPASIKVDPIQLSWIDSGPIRLGSWDYSVEYVENMIRQSSTSWFSATGKVKQIQRLFAKDDLVVTDLTLSVNIAPEINTDPRNYVIYKGRIERAGAKRVANLMYGEGTWRFIRQNIEEKLRSRGFKLGTAVNQRGDDESNGFSIQFPYQER